MFHECTLQNSHHLLGVPPICRVVCQVAEILEFQLQCPHFSWADEADIVLRVVASSRMKIYVGIRKARLALKRMQQSVC
jgi:hypothetical protein